MSSSVNQTENLLFMTLLQLIVMVGAARCMHTVFRRLGQPGVIGEIFAGLLLGPSLVGHFFPQASLALFGQRASAPITILSQIGLILLMFQIGTDFEFGHLGTPRNRRATVWVTVFSVAVPLVVGCALGWLSAPVLASSIPALPYSLFLGLGMAITAVPILGRILRQYGLTHTEVGVVAISAAAINDVIGWLLRAEHRLRPRTHSSEGFHDVGDHGGRHDIDGWAASEAPAFCDRTCDSDRIGSLKKSTRPRIHPRRTQPASHLLEAVAAHFRQ